MVLFSLSASAVLFMTITTFLLSLLIVFASPFVHGVWFIKTEINGQHIAMGVYGICKETTCSRLGAGYELSPIANRAITGPMVIWTVVAGLSFTAMLFSIPPLFCTDVAFGEPRAAQVIHRAVMGSVFILCCTVWIITVVGWSIVVRAMTIEGHHAELGPAVWIGLASVIASFSAFILQASGGHAPRSPSSGPLGAQPTNGEDFERGGSRPPGDGYWHYKHTTRVVQE